MTTIIVIVVVALVFFVTVCVVSFMIWKRESEMRTDSIRAIEENLEKLTYGLSSDLPTDDRGNTANAGRKRDIGYMEPVTAESTSAKPKRNRNWDPFGWVRETDCSDSDESEYKRMTNRKEEQRKKAENNDIEDIEVAEFIEEQEGDSLFDNEEKTEIYREMVHDEPEKTEQRIETNETNAVNDIDESYDKEYDGEIDLDFIETANVDNNSEAASKGAIGYDIGRSGRKYTAAELETLIKE